jgi:signal transduction histidine kinase/CheY-like chemotaxis protein
MTPPEYRDVDLQAHQELIANGTSQTYEKEYLLPDGTRLPILIGVAAFDEKCDAGLSFILDITQRKQAEDELRRAHDELEARVQRRTAQLAAANDELKSAKEAADAARILADKANMAKSEFLSRMSHELRTPLNAILGFGQILTMQELDPLGQESIEHILKAGDHLLRLINEVLDIARVESGRMDLSIEPVELRDVVRESLDLIRPLAVKSGIAVILDEHKFPPGETFAQADRQRLKQAIINLLNNGIKYNNPEGAVVVTCRQTQLGKVRLEVSDTGPGIAPENMRKLFLPFERLDAGKTSIEGTGLGLTLSQRMIVAMGGVLGVESVVGEGSTFYIELPQSACPVEALQAEATLAIEEKASDTEFTVLSIEDNFSNYRLIETILRYRPGAKLLGAMQGRLGLELAQQHHPDVILLDLHLPDIRGHEVLKQLRANASTADIPVIIVSADATPGQIDRLMNAGADAYLTKPLNIKELLRRLDEFVEKKKR